MKANNLLDIIDFQFSFSKEMIENSGEDSYFADLIPDKVISSVFDGCGGLGAKEYANFRNKTGAYIASRAISGATKKWFDSIENVVDEKKYKDYIDVALNTIDENADKDTFVFKGSMQKSFPTTIAAVVIQHQKDISVDFLWAGDSRGYILDESGLHQITIDDIDGEDAMSNLSNDGVLTNLAYLNGKYEIHKKTVKVKKPSVIFVATDGCFGYVSTPMEFENILIETLLTSQTPNNWKALLYEEIGKIAGDDYTLSLIAIGFEDYATLKKVFLKRKKILDKEYLNGIETKTYEEKQQLWNKYKKIYETI